MLNSYCYLCVYTWVRKNNNSIPDEVLDLMKNAALGYEALKKQNESLSWDVDVLAIDNDDLEKQNALLVEALQPLANLAFEVFKDTREDKEGTLYAFNKGEIKYSDLRKAKELLNNLKK